MSKKIKISEQQSKMLNDLDKTKVLKINEQQAKMLKDLDKTKVLKLTQEQYDRIVEFERLDESIANDMGNAMSSDAQKQFRAMEENVSETYADFINELYGIKEGMEKKYEKFTKLMEVAELINNNKIVKGKFGNNPNIVREVITMGLEEMANGGNEYSAVASMEAALKDVVNDFNKEGGLKNDLTQKQLSDGQPFKSLVAKYLLDNKLDFDRDVYNEYMAKRYKSAWLELRNATSKEIVKEEEPEIPIGIVGLDILKYEPFKYLRQTRKRVEGDSTVSVKVPNFDGNGYYTLTSAEDLKGWVQTYLHVPDRKISGYIDNFKERFKGEPIFELTPDGKFDVEILNPVFIKHTNRNRDLAGGGEGITEDDLDEMTSAGSSGQSTGKLGSEPIKRDIGINQPTVGDDLSNFKSLTEMDTTNGVGEYDVNAIEDPNMEGNNPKGSGPTHKKAFGGGNFVEIDDKCKKMPYCNQGIEGVKIKKNKAVSEIAKRTGKDINEVIQIIKNFKQK